MKFKQKYYKYMDDHIRQYESLLFMSYEEWLEDLVTKLGEENSLLCPIGDLDTIQSLLTEKKFYMEEISHLNKSIEQKDNAFDLLMDHSKQIEYERDNLRKVLRKLGVSEEQERELILEVQREDVKDGENDVNEYLKEKYNGKHLNKDFWLNQ